MHTEHTAVAASNARPEGTHALTAIVPLTRPAPTERSSAEQSAFALPVVGTGTDERALSVRYELDVVTHRWVASIVDDDSGEVVRTVPSKQVLHQLAALRRPPLDLHA